MALGQHHELVAAEATDRVPLPKPRWPAGLPRPTSNWSPARWPKRVVDVLEVVEVEEQRRHRHVFPPRSREHLADPVEDQGAVGRPVSESCNAWWLELAVRSCTMLMARDRLVPSTKMTVTSSRLSRSACQRQEGQASRWPEDAHRGRSGKNTWTCQPLCRSTVVEMGTGGNVPALKVTDEVPLLVVERHRGGRVVDQRSGQDDTGQRRRPGPPDEGGPTLGDRRRHGAVPVDRRAEHQLGTGPRAVGDVGLLTGIAGPQEGSPHLGVAEVEAHRCGRGGSRHRGGGQAVEGPRAGRGHLVDTPGEWRDADRLRIAPERWPVPAPAPGPAPRGRSPRGTGRAPGPRRTTGGIGPGWHRGSGRRSLPRPRRDPARAGWPASRWRRSGSTT